MEPKKTKAELIALVESLTTERDSAQATVNELQRKLDQFNTLGTINESSEKLIQKIAKLQKANEVLRGIIELSCQDHCPHHMAEEACRNCEIQKRQDAIEKEK